MKVMSRSVKAVGHPNRAQHTLIHDLLNIMHASHNCCKLHSLQVGRRLAMQAANTRKHTQPTDTNTELHLDALSAHPWIFCGEQWFRLAAVPRRRLAAGAPGALLTRLRRPWLSLFLRSLSRTELTAPAQHSRDHEEENHWNVEGLSRLRERALCVRATPEVLTVICR